MFDEVLHLVGCEHLSDGNGCCACHGECELAEELFGGQMAMVGSGGEEVGEEALRVEAFEACGVAYDRDMSAAEVVDVEAEACEVVADGGEDGHLGGGELHDFGEEVVL